MDPEKTAHQMNIEELRAYCLAKGEVTESFPFDETTLVFKVAGKMFCMTDLEDSFTINLKNDPERNLELRERYLSIRPGYHMNKRHWNTVDIDGSVPDSLIRQLIDDSYRLVVGKLPKTERDKITGKGQK